MAGKETVGIDISSLPHLVTLYGYPVLIGAALVSAAGTPLPLTSLLLALGALSAARGGPDFTLLLIFGTLGCVTGDLVDYGAGWFGGSPLLAWITRRRRFQGANLARAHDLLQRRGGPAIFVTRFAFTAVASPISVLVGASRLKPAVFLAWDIAGELLYVLSAILLGRIVGGDLAEDSSFGALLTIVTVLTIAVPLLVAGVRWALAVRSRRAYASGRRAGEALPHDVPVAADDQPVSAAIPRY